MAIKKSSRYPTHISEDDSKKMPYQICGRECLNESTPEPSNRPSFVRISESELNLLRNLSRDQALVLLTPMVPPPPQSALDQDVYPFKDPFEPLGRDLALRHPRVQHVPYVPRIGMTAMHAEFIRNAGALVVVVCETSNPEMARRNGNASSSPADQRKFAARVRRMLQTSGLEQYVGQDEILNVQPPIPVVLVYVSETSALPVEETAFDEELGRYSTVLHSNQYNSSSLRAAAELLFSV
jgi:hypothetical protein